MLSLEKEVIQNDLKKYQYNVFEELSNYFINKPHNLCSGTEALTTLHNIKMIKEEEIV
jgi:hypothetical protein